MTGAEATNGNGMATKVATTRPVFVVRRPVATSSGDDSGYVFRVASLTKSVLDDLERNPSPVLPQQRPSVVNARRFVERAERGRRMLERTEAHFVSDIKAVGTYSSARRVLDTLDNDGESASYLEKTRDLLRRLDEGEDYASINEDERSAARAFFEILSDVFGADVAAEASGFRAIERSDKS